jgi:hypothetical protein
MNTKILLALAFLILVVAFKTRSQKLTTLSYKYLTHSDEVSSSASALQRVNPEVRLMRENQLAAQGEWLNYASDFFVRVGKAKEYRSYLNLYTKKRNTREKVIKEKYKNEITDGMMDNPHSINSVMVGQEMDLARNKIEEQHHEELRRLLDNHYEEFIKLKELVKNDLKVEEIDI